jgi:hypothetical protein|tara:strand:+ start:1373 stop:1528 length:156 start_codon:yes stop_codon:yes gene_type:complete
LGKQQCENLNYLKKYVQFATALFRGVKSGKQFGMKFVIALTLAEEIATKTI